MYQVMGASATDAILRNTVYSHFVGGEDTADLKPKLQVLHEHGVGGILDYAAEADLDETETHVGRSAHDHGHQQHVVVDANQPARVYPYVNEAECDANKRIFLRAVEAVKETTPEGFAAVKVTALGDPALLERVSIAVVELRKFFDRLDADQCGVLTRSTFIDGWCQAFDVSTSEAGDIFDQIDDQRTRNFSTEALRQTPGEVSVLEFTNALKLSQISSLVKRCRSEGPLFRSALDEAECAALRRLLGRLDEIAACARSLGVRLMIDAEHTYFQPAIDHAVLRLSRKHNLDWPCVYGTYQAYLVECRTKLALDLERSHREGWHLGAKLVRGAYMVHERQRAAERGYPDPIHPTVEETHASYDGAIDALLLHCPSPERTSVMIASHNRASIERVASYLLVGSGGSAGRADRDDDDVLADATAASSAAIAHGAGVAAAAATSEPPPPPPPPPRCAVPAENVTFGQLLGMADHLTFTLAAHGLKAYKYVPYGPVREVVPYLLRRAQENADALSGASEQRNMMLAEVRRRWVGL